MNAKVWYSFADLIIADLLCVIVGIYSGELHLRSNSPYNFQRNINLENKKLKFFYYHKTAVVFLQEYFNEIKLRKQEKRNICKI